MRISHHGIPQQHEQPWLGLESFMGGGIYVRSNLTAVEQIDRKHVLFR